MAEQEPSLNLSLLKQDVSCVAAKETNGLTVIKERLPVPSMMALSSQLGEISIAELAAVHVVEKLVGINGECF